MTRILFVCHGNICRSTMAQYVMDWMVERAGRAGQIECDSAATSTEELGNPVDPRTPPGARRHPVRRAPLASDDACRLRSL